ncbi:MAG: hypothetical protein WAW86_03610 [Gammaproteobacteria bacterium]
MYKYLTALIFATLTITSANAEVQKISSCLTVQKNHSKFSFHTEFASTDVFDNGSKSGSIYNGTVCHSHTYQYGPKTINLTLKSKSPKVYFNLDSACQSYGMQVYSLEAAKIKHKRTSGSKAEWNFVLVETAQDATMAKFDVHCDYRTS